MPGTMCSFGNSVSDQISISFLPYYSGLFPMPKKPEMTPMMRQYHAIKDEVPDTLLMFRLGDFYELFYEDAVTASRELEITLTARHKERGPGVPMCGVPYHAAESTFLDSSGRATKSPCVTRPSRPRRESIWFPGKSLG